MQGASKAKTPSPGRDANALVAFCMSTVYLAELQSPQELGTAQLAACLRAPCAVQLPYCRQAFQCTKMKT